MKNQVSKTAKATENQEQKISMSTYMTMPKIKNKIIEMVGSIDAPRFVSSVVSAVAANPDLAECSQPSIFNAALLGESLKLSPSPQLGQYYMVPYRNNKTGVRTAQFQIGYKGYIQLAIRSGQYKKLNVLEIKDGELIKWDPLNEEIQVRLIEDEAERAKTPTIGYYAMMEYNNGFRKAMYWSREKMESHAQTYSRGYQAKKGYTFWETNFDEMAKKTMLRQLISKWGVMSIDMQKGYEADMASISDVDKNTVEASYIDAKDVINANANSAGEIGFSDAEADTEISIHGPAPEPEQTTEQIPEESEDDIDSEPGF